jgi:phage shock protein A
MFRRISNFFKGLVHNALFSLEKRNPEALLAATREELRAHMIKVRQGRAQLASVSESLKRQIANGQRAVRELEGRILVLLQAGREDTAAELAIELERIKDELATNQEEFESNEAGYKEFTELTNATERQLQEKMRNYGRMISQARAKEAAAEAAEMVSGAITKMSGAGASMERLDEAIHAKHDNAAGRLRAARDTSGFSSIKAEAAERDIRGKAALANFKAARGMGASAPAKPAAETEKPSMGPAESQ